MGKVIRDQDELARRLRLFRQQGKTVVLANGCFDLLHVGHVRALRDASSRGHYLVVALNSDRSVARLKGAGRPVQTEAERAEIVAALDGVDYVTIFHEDSVDALLRKLRPSVLAKGPEYTMKNLPEAATLKEVGGELVRVGDPKDHSTRDLIGQILGGKAAKTTAAKGARQKSGAKKKAPARRAAPKAKAAPKKKAASRKPATGKTTSRKTGAGKRAAAGR